MLRIISTYVYRPLTNHLEIRIFKTVADIKIILKTAASIYER